MKVINISNYYAEFAGSFIEQLSLLGEKIISEQNDIVYIFPKEAKEKGWCKLLSIKYKIYFIDLIKKTNQKKIIKELKNIFITENPDIVHSHFDGYDVAITKAANKNVIKIYHRHNEFDVSNLCWYKKIYADININMKMAYLRKKGYSIFTSKDTMNSFFDKGYVLKERSITIMNGISTKRLDKKYDIKKIRNKPVAFSIIGNWNRKGGDILFKAFEKINSSEIKVYLSSIASNDFILKQFGYIPQWFISLDITDDIAKYYSMADIFITSSRKETFSYALAEAIYCKLPCISSDIDGVQWAKEIPSVSFFESTNINGLVDKIIKVLASAYDEKVYALSKKIVKDKYSEDIWVEYIVNFYKKLV